MFSTISPTRHFSTHDYFRMTEAGIFLPDERLELLNGAIYSMTPQNSRHAATIGIIAEFLTHHLSPEYSIRIQMPLNIDPDSSPEPDLAVVPGRPKEYIHDHPHTALLVVEVSDTTLQRDQSLKSSIYAQAGIPEYWIVNLKAQSLEVLSGPQASGFQHHTLFSISQTFQSSILPKTPLAVSDLFPG